MSALVVRNTGEGAAPERREHGEYLNVAWAWSSPLGFFSCTACIESGRVGSGPPSTVLGFSSDLPDHPSSESYTTPYAALCALLENHIRRYTTSSTSVSRILWPLEYLLERILEMCNYEAIHTKCHLPAPPDAPPCPSTTQHLRAPADTPTTYRATPAPAPAPSPSSSAWSWPWRDLLCADGWQTLCGTLRQHLRRPFPPSGHFGSRRRPTERHTAPQETLVSPCAMSLHPPSRAHRCSGRQRYCLPHKLNTTVVPRPELRCAACQSWELKMRDRARARARARGIPCGTEDEKQRVVRDEPRAQAMMQVPNSLDMRGFEDEHHETEEAEEADEAEEDTTLLSGFRD